MLVRRAREIGLPSFPPRFSSLATLFPPVPWSHPYVSLCSSLQRVTGLSLSLFPSFLSSFFLDSFSLFLLLLAQSTLKRGGGTLNSYVGVNLKAPHGHVPMCALKNVSKLLRTAFIYFIIH